MEKNKERRQTKKLKTPSIKKFFSKLGHEDKKETVNLERGNNFVGKNIVGVGRLVDNGVSNAKQRDIEAQVVNVSRENTVYGERRHTSKDNMEQQHVVQQKKIGRDTEIYDAGCVGQPVTGLERSNECTEQLPAEY